LSTSVGKIGVTSPHGERLQSLMRRYQNGDREAASEIVNALSPKMFQFFMAQARSRSDAEDLLQDFWLRVHNAKATYRPSEPFLPWAYTIAHRVRIDNYRRSRRKTQHEFADENAIASASAAVSKQPESVGEILSTLPESQREVLLLMKVSGLTLEEVARSTGSSVGAVKQKAHRAYEKLRKLLGGSV
jgi:RNA polymerase sigma-70 factor (ECF subfamily)